MDRDIFLEYFVLWVIIGTYGSHMVGDPFLLKHYVFMTSWMSCSSMHNTIDGLPHWYMVSDISDGDMIWL